MYGVRVSSIVVDDGMKLVTAAEAGRICDLSAETFLNYSRTRRPKSNPAPRPIERDLETGGYLFSEEEVREWHSKRMMFHPQQRKLRARKAVQARWAKRDI